MQLLVLDEAHLIYEWHDFRESFLRLKPLGEAFPLVPKLALSETLKPSSLQRMTKQIMRDPIVIKGCVDRKNVSITITVYQLVQQTTNESAKKKKKE